MRCPECGSGWVDPTDPDVCPKCGHHNVSVADDSLDRMVQAASAPNLATLFRRAKESGVIESFETYTGGPPA